MKTEPMLTATKKATGMLPSGKLNMGTTFGSPPIALAVSKKTR